MDISFFVRKCNVSSQYEKNTSTNQIFDFLNAAQSKFEKIIALNFHYIIKCQGTFFTG